MKLQEKTDKNTIYADYKQVSDHPYRILIVGSSGSGKQMYYSN